MIADSATAPAPGEGSPFTFNRAPPRECDLVMKGGLTSGIVYPPAVLELQQTFRFRSIGGTSAGAIAAALTAAAEHGRERGGFEKLDVLRLELNRDGFLLDLLAPAPETAPAFHTLVDAFLKQRRSPAGEKSTSWWATAHRFVTALNARFDGGSGTAIGGLIGTLPAAFAASCIYVAHREVSVLLQAHVLLLLIPLGLAGFGLGAFVGGTLGATLALWRVFTEYLPGNGFFGLALGHDPEESNAAPTHLTSWLCDRIDRLAGNTGPDPLTFAQLAGEGWETSPSQEPAISLRVVTTNLSHATPHVLPMKGRVFLFNEAEMRRLFPARVVNYMVKKGGTANLELPDGYHFLPEGDELPVVVAARLSLSFPVLLAAVPLYTIKQSAFAERKASAPDGMFAFQPEHLQRHWFSDGGICSNFPIHFFDSWLPQRPTFGITLVDKPADKPQQAPMRYDDFTYIDSTGDEETAVWDADPAAGAPDLLNDVHLPNARDHVLPQYGAIEGLPQFFGAMFNSAQNHRDMTQSLLPSYRERIAQVRLEKDEGGLNLTMKPDAIVRMEAKGREAGKRLAGMDFPQHQWVRLLVLMAHVERAVARMNRAFPDSRRYEELFGLQNAARASGAPWYRARVPEWAAAATERLEGLIALQAAWNPQREGEEQPVNTFFSGGREPRPPSTMRVTPPT